MRKIPALIFICALAATSTGFNLYDSEETPEEILAEEETPQEVPEEARTPCLKTGAECDGSKDDCQCCGAYVECKCPFGINWPSVLGPCKCSMDHLGTCLAKQRCPNKHEWGGGDCKTPKKPKYG
uniref:Putative neurotoxin LTDF S-14 n=1 Tax=Dolomedes fimbriatus TaxID=1432569 RepID=A0A0K1D8Y8_9ARAC|nr:putative neurotoxin LTDF S-14 [Dolomedes fimbriatus]